MKTVRKTKTETKVEIVMAGVVTRGFSWGADDSLPISEPLSMRLEQVGANGETCTELQIEIEGARGGWRTVEFKEHPARVAEMLGKAEFVIAGDRLPRAHRHAIVVSNRHGEIGIVYVQMVEDKAFGYHTVSCTLPIGGFKNIVPLGAQFEKIGGEALALPLHSAMDFLSMHFRGNSARRHLKRAQIPSGMKLAEFDPVGDQPARAAPTVGRWKF